MKNIFKYLSIYFGKLKNRVEEPLNYVLKVKLLRTELLSN